MRAEVSRTVTKGDSISNVRLSDGRLVLISKANNRTLGGEFESVVSIEEESFPPSIRDTTSYLIKLAESPLELFLVARVLPSKRIIGYLAAERLELFDDVPGVRDDSHFGLGDSVYLASVAVTQDHRHQGVGIAMEKECLTLSRAGTFVRVTAHVADGSLSRMRLNGRVIRSFDNWYSTGHEYDYIELPL